MEQDNITSNTINSTICQIVRLYCGTLRTQRGVVAAILFGEGLRILSPSNTGGDWTLLLRGLNVYVEEEDGEYGRKGVD